MATAEFGLDNRGQRRILVYTSFREKPLIQSIPGARYDGELRAWKVRPTYAACTQLNAVFGKAIKVSDEIKAFARHAYDEALLLESIKSEPPENFNLEYHDGLELKPFQGPSVSFLISSGGAVLGDDMGLGKTVQGCALLEALHVDLSLVVCPKGVRRHWAKHIELWARDAAHIIDGGKKTREKKIHAAYEEGGVLVMNWHLLQEHSRLAGYGSIRLSEKDRTPKELNEKKFDVVLGDEAHCMGSPKNKWTRAMWALDAEHAFPLTGTPIEKDPSQLWPLLHMVDADEWPSRQEFIDRYCETAYNPHSRGVIVTGVTRENRAEFYHLTGRHFIRRTKEEVGLGIDVEQVVRHVELPPKLRKLYKQFREEKFARVEDGFVRGSNALSVNSRLVQICAANLKQTHVGNPDDPDDNDQFTMVKPSPKVDELKAVLAELGDRQAIVWSASVPLIDLATEMMDASDISYVKYTGEVSQADRDEAVDRFQAGDARIFIGTPAAGGEGIELTAADVMIYLQRPWSMIENKQSADRNNRIGQEATELLIIDIITEDTVDENVYEAFFSKSAKLDELTPDTNMEDYV